MNQIVLAALKEIDSLCTHFIKPRIERSMRTVSAASQSLLKDRQN
jgi:hypothetical protein